jgi:hypothetical protein
MVIEAKRGSHDLTGLSAALPAVCPGNADRQTSVRAFGNPKRRWALARADITKGLSSPSGR